jgi:hypothetical protein
LLGKCTDRVARRADKDRIARFEFRRPGPHRGHDTAGIEPERARQLIFRNALQIAMRDLEVDRIEAGGMDFDSDVAGARGRIGDFRQADMVGDRAIAVENKGSHESSCRAEGFWQQQGERGRVGRNLLVSGCTSCPRP